MTVHRVVRYLRPNCWRTALLLCCILSLSLRNLSISNQNWFRADPFRVSFRVLAFLSANTRRAGGLGITLGSIYYEIQHHSETDDQSQGTSSAFCQLQYQVPAQHPYLDQATRTKLYSLQPEASIQIDSLLHPLFYWQFLRKSKPKQKGQVNSQILASIPQRSTVDCKGKSESKWGSIVVKEGEWGWQIHSLGETV